MSKAICFKCGKEYEIVDKLPYCSKCSRGLGFTTKATMETINEIFGDMFGDKPIFGSKT